MPMTIVFDTNYLRSFGPTEYLNNALPEKLNSQIHAITRKSYLLIIPETVRIETNAWLEDESRKKYASIGSSIKTLEQNGFTVVPSIPPKSTSIDIVNLLQKFHPSCSVLSPQIEEYLEAERRTSYRLEPHPKNPDHEEMRDRLIWCQLIKYAKTTENLILIISADTIFKNGAGTDEGKIARIIIASTPDDLDQHLGQIPVHIKKILDQMTVFEKDFMESGIGICNPISARIEDLKKVRINDNEIEQRFNLFVNGEGDFTFCKLTTINNAPVSLRIENEKVNIVFNRENPTESKYPESAIYHNPIESATIELRRIIGG